MPTLTMRINPDGHSWPATSADRSLLRRKMKTRAAIPYRTAPARVDYLVSLCAATGISVTFVPTDHPSPSPRATTARPPRDSGGRAVIVCTSDRTGPAHLTRPPRPIRPARTGP